MDLNEAFAEARTHHKAGRRAEAEQLYRAILARVPTHPGALNLLGLIAHDAGKDDEAVRLIGEAIAIRPGAAAYHNNLGIALAALKENERAEAAYREAIRLRPDYGGALYNLGTVLQARGDTDAALATFETALTAEPGLAEAHLARAGILAGRRRPAEAEAGLREAVRLKPDLGPAWFALGALLRQAGRIDEAVEAFRRAVRCDPKVAAGYNNLGAALQTWGAQEPAERCFRRALKLEPESAETWYNLAHLLEGTDRLEEARDAYERATRGDAGLALQALYPLTLVRRKLCDWDDEPARLAELSRRTEAHLGENTKVALQPLTLNVFDVPAPLRLAVARHQATIIEGEVAEARMRCAFVHRTTGPERRLRIGYVSPDFRQHAVGTLIQGLFEHHDREAVEVFAYALLPADDAITARIRAGAEHFVDVSRLPFEETARRIHADGIDVLLDVAGYTTYSRTPVFALRPAPVQAHWLGYLDTMGADFLPWMLTDDIVVTDEMRALYPEALVTLPDSFTVATPLAVDLPAPTRAEAGLPDGAFVFCCFNALHKLDAACFDSWMRILRRVPDAVLWLYDNASPAAAERLKCEAAARGVPAGRLVFAGRVPFEAYVARYAAADLFLDTFAYNAGATAAHALWSGLPLLTLPGRTIFGRMGASLCRSAGVPEMVAASVADFEDRAVHFATHRGELAAVRTKLASARATAPLFDVPRFARALEAAYAGMWRSHSDGKAPRPFHVDL